MYAIVKMGSEQQKVKVGDLLEIQKIEGSVGDTVTFDHILLYGDDNVVKLGTPTLKNASVSATIKEQKRDPKVIVFKYKRRKNHKKTRGHKQYKTVIEINAIAAV